MGGHPFAGDDELVLVVAEEVGPGGGGDHADMGDIWVEGGGDIGEVSVSVVEVEEAGGVGAIFAGDASAADKEVGEAVVVEVTGDGDGGVDAVGMGGEGVGCEGEVAVAVIEEEAVLHLPAIGGLVIAAGSDEEVGVAVVVGVEEEDGLVFEVRELEEGGLRFFDEPAGGGLEVELTGVCGGAADIDVGEAVAVDVGAGGFWPFAGEEFRQVVFVVKIDVIVFLVFVEGGFDGLQEGGCFFGGLQQAGWRGCSFGGDGVGGSGY